MGQKKRKTQKKKEACLLCGRNEDDEIVYGKFFQKKDFSIHQNCMFLSSGLAQRGSKESEGVLGFLIEDIKQEYARGQKLKCCYCKQEGATLGCIVTSCKKSFHLPCGIKNLALNQHFGDFSSYCHIHKLKQKRIQIKEELYCYICCSALTEGDLEDCLYPPCCKKNWFHHNCIQKYAISAGLHFFKCPLCNNATTFLEKMKKYGISIPNKDASWELESNAFNELLYRPKCGASECSCRLGREHDGKGAWDLLACAVCGADARHKQCGNLKKSDEKWECDDCKAFEAAQKKREDSVINDSKSASIKTQNNNGETTINADEEVEISIDDISSSQYDESALIATSSCGDKTRALHGDKSVSVTTSTCDDGTTSENKNIESKEETTSVVKDKSLLDVRYKLRSFSIVLSKIAVDKTDKLEGSIFNKECVDAECESKSNFVGSSKSGISLKSEGNESALSSETKLNDNFDKSSALNERVLFSSDNNDPLCKNTCKIIESVSSPMDDHVNDTELPIVKSMLPLPTIHDTSLKAFKSVKEFSLMHDKDVKALGDGKNQLRQKKSNCLKDRNEIVEDKRSQSTVKLKRQAPNNSNSSKPKRRKVIGNGCCSGSNHCIKKMFGISCENCK